MEAIADFFAREHVFFSHFPIALILSGALVRLWWALRPSNTAWDASQIMLGFGAVGVFFSVLSGLFLTHFQAALPQPLLTHRTCAFLLGGWAVAHLILTLRMPAWLQTRLPSALWALLGAGLTLMTGYYGSLVAGR